MSNDIVTIGNFDIARRNGPKTFIPYGPDNASYYFTQEFVQQASKRQLLPLNTTYNAGGEILSNYYLVAESQAVPFSGSLVKWTRTYAPIFLDHVEYESFAYQFPLTATGYGTLVPLRGMCKMDAWQSELRCKHFLVGVSCQDVTPKAKILDQSQIQIICPVPIFEAVTMLSTNDLRVAGAWPILNPQLTPDCVGDGNGGNTPWTSGTGYSITQTDYLLKVLGQTQTGSSGSPPTPTYSTPDPKKTWIVAQSSTIQNVFGNLYVRKTRYVQAR